MSAFNMFQFVHIIFNTNLHSYYKTNKTVIVWQKKIAISKGFDNLSNTHSIKPCVLTLQFAVNHYSFILWSTMFLFSTCYQRIAHSGAKHIHLWCFSKEENTYVVWVMKCQRELIIFARSKCSTNRTHLFPGKQQLFQYFVEFWGRQWWQQKRILQYSTKGLQPQQDNYRVHHHSSHLLNITFSLSIPTLYMYIYILMHFQT